MTTDLWMLLAAAGLQWLLIMIPATMGILDNGIGWAFGNREDAKNPAAWVDRASRADRNLKENLPLFAILVLVAHVTQAADATTALSAQTSSAPACSTPCSIWPAFRACLPWPGSPRWSAWA